MMNITLTKKGVGTVIMSQTVTGGLVDIQLGSGIGFSTDVDGANELYIQYIQNGYTIKPHKEPKVAAPKKDPKPKKSREESLTEKYGTKEDRKAYIEAKKAFRRFYLSKGMKYGKEFDATVKYALKKWEEAGRPAYNC